jgi:hypothetical protein
VLSDQSLIQKLHAAGVIDKRVNELRFSDEFCRHLVAFNRAHGFKGSGTIETWRDILDDFNESLNSMSDKEVATTIVLLDYFLDKLSNDRT